MVSDATESVVSAVTAPVLVTELNEETPATIPTLVKVKSPVDAPVKLPVANFHLSVLSSHITPALSLLPLSTTIPASPDGVPEVPFANSIILSDITVLVVDIVVVVP